MTERTSERLRAALNAEADEVDVDPDAWSTVQQRVRSHRPHRSPAARRTLLVAAAIVVAALGVRAMLERDDTTVDVVPADAVPVEAGDFEGIWPFWSQEQLDAYEADPGTGMFFDAEATALEFAREFLGMPDPVAPRGYFPAEGFSGWVDVNPKPGSPLVTKVWVHRYGGDRGAYSVYFAETDNIRVDREALGESIGTTFEVDGTSTAFEATVIVEVRDAVGRSLGRSFVMGGANGDFAPFHGELSIDTPEELSAGAVIFTTESAEDGAVQEATVVRVRFDVVDGTAFSLFFHRGEDLVEVHRTGPATAGVLRQALDALVAGPRPEDGDGLGSFFSEETADVLAGVGLRDGTAIVDFAEAVNNASTSAGSVGFLAELDATIFQFPTVDRIEYRLQGSCDSFWSWLQVGSCEIVERPEG